MRCDVGTKKHFLDEKDKEVCCRDLLDIQRKLCEKDDDLVGSRDRVEEGL